MSSSVFSCSRLWFPPDLSSLPEQVASEVVLILLLNAWLVMWKVKGEGGMLTEYGRRQEELWIFSDHNDFLFSSFLHLHRLSWNTVCQYHLSGASQGFALTDVCGSKVTYVKCRNTKLYTGSKAGHFGPTRNVSFSFLLILQLLCLPVSCAAGKRCSARWWCLSGAYLAQQQTALLSNLPIVVVRGAQAGNAGIAPAPGCP